MRSPKLPFLILALLVVICFSLSARLDPHFQALQPNRPDDILATLLGDSRRLLANDFFVKADAYFHSGFYPTIFDNQESFKTAHLAEDAGALKSKNQGEETEFMGKPRDIIEEFNRHFLPSIHTHLDSGGPEGLKKPGEDLGEADGGEVREILPWLKISAELDPNRIETYMVTAYWLRKRLGKVDEAEQFLREGLRANPRNPSLLFELGRIYREDRKDAVHARNLWELGVQTLERQKTKRTEQDDFMLYQLALNLARLEEAEGNLPAAIHWLELHKTVAPDAQAAQEQLEELQKKITASKAASPVPPQPKNQ